jgi:uncharacterized membrane protein YobD (UPF0266 family)|tara:strand:+ start:496 stop:771 length:276 start_codon:yes stop_codon:yes gene_type:complete
VVVLEVIILQDPQTHRVGPVVDLVVDLMEEKTLVQGELHHQTQIQIDKVIQVVETVVTLVVLVVVVAHMGQETQKLLTILVVMAVLVFNPL